MDTRFILPDTSLVREARAIAAATLSPALLHHSMRTYLLGRAWAERRRLDFDDEGFLAAALFHDFGLLPPWRDSARAFPLNSSRALREFLIARSIPSSRVAPLVDAIEFHMQILPRWSKGNVAGLMQVGAWMDITGLRRWNVWAEAKEIARAWPRAGIDLEFPRRFLGVLTSVPACAGLLLPERFRGE